MERARVGRARGKDRVETLKVGTGSGGPRKFRSWTLVIAILTALALLLLVLAGCGGDEEAGDGGAEETASGSSDVILASTTSTQDSGLFDVLLPAFEAAYPEYSVKVLAVGTGEALELGRRKDADVLLVHAPEAEKEFVSEGYGTERREVMYNDFVIVGPPGDPAGVRGESDAAVALRAIADVGAEFISRGDDSGTHKKELSLWEAAGVTPTGSWYQETGQGMGEVLRIASEKQAYTLTDRATFLNLEDTLDLEILVEGDEELFNQYGVIPVSEAGNPEGAQAFADWITSEEGQSIIADFGIEQFGEPLFTPNAGK